MSERDPQRGGGREGGKGEVGIRCENVIKFPQPVISNITKTGPIIYLLNEIYSLEIEQLLFQFPSILCIIENIMGTALYRKKMATDTITK